MTQKDIDDFINKKMTKASRTPIALFYMLGLKEHITVEILERSTGDKFEFSLKKL